MLLLSVVEELKIVAELVPIDRTQPCPENKIEFDLTKPFTANHHINLIYVDKKKGHAYFCSESLQELNSD